jgi:formylglycine-generating enzyme
MVRLPEGYCIDSTEVTRAQYQAWLDTNPSTAGQISDCTRNGGFVPDVTCMLSTFVCQSGCDNHPQVCVDWCDAYAYCQAVGKRLCGKIGGGPNGYNDYANASLSQWYNACGSDGVNNAFPYGSTYQPDYCNGFDFAVSGSAYYMAAVPVGSMPSCQSSVSGYQGVYDLSGNVMEWEDSCDGSYCHLRGGSFNTIPAGYLACGILQPGESLGADGYVGFRCCS